MMNRIRWILTKRKFKYLGTGSCIKMPVYIKNPKYIKIGNKWSGLWNIRIEAWDQYFDQHFTPEIIIGDNVEMNSDIHIGCINKVIIGNNVLMASRIFITDHMHGNSDSSDLHLPPAKRELVSKGPVIIEDNVWIGEGVSILSGVTIGKNSIIGANAVVTKSFPENSVIGGVPAKLIKSI
jgi:acetyltransferase-like isoleucine patch superfamily enzyme